MAKARKLGRGPPVLVALRPKSKSTASNAKPIKFLNAVHR